MDGAHLKRSLGCIHDGKEERDGRPPFRYVDESPGRQGPAAAASNQLSCSISKNTCEAGPGDDADCGTTNGGDPCSCVVTTNGASFCGSIADIDCGPCVDSDDCAVVSGPGSVCVRAVGACLCNSGEVTFCIPPCIPDPVKG